MALPTLPDNRTIIGPAIDLCLRARVCRAVAEYVGMAARADAGRYQVSTVCASYAAWTRVFAGSGNRAAAFQDAEVDVVVCVLRKKEAGKRTTTFLLAGAVNVI